MFSKKWLKKKQQISRLKRARASGQVVVEYILMIVAALFMLGLIGTGFLKIRDFMWQKIICNVTAACPTCPPDPSIRNRLAPRACQ